MMCYHEQRGKQMLVYWECYKTTHRILNYRAYHQKRLNTEISLVWLNTKKRGRGRQSKMYVESLNCWATDNNTSNPTLSKYEKTEDCWVMVVNVCSRPGTWRSRLPTVYHTCIDVMCPKIIHLSDLLRGSQ